MSGTAGDSRARALPEGGRVRPIVRWGAEVLHRPCRPVTDFGPDLASLVADLIATMRAADGVGLAANQLGVALSVFVFRCSDANEELLEGVVCNPRLQLPEGDARRLDEAEEGCLSLPGAFAPCARPDRAVVTGVDEVGTPASWQGTGLLARCLQHETDHLHGTVFADRLSRRNRRALLAAAEDAEPGFPADWPVSPALS